jgi:hypothetical protein
MKEYYKTNKTTTLFLKKRTKKIVLNAVAM